MNPASILASSKGKNCKHSITEISEAAAELGTQGGLVGGPARAKVLSKAQRREIAVHAINMRWGRRCGCRYC
jgi:hypothetical protein